MGTETVTVVSDLHVGVERDEYTDLEPILHECESSDFCVVLGDVIHETDDFGVDLDNLQWVAETLNDSVETPVYFLGGNHDANVFTQGVFESITGTDQNQIIDVADDVQLVLLDTAFGRKVPNTGWIGDDGIDVLNEASDRDMQSIVLTHFPVTYTDQYQETTWFDEYPEGVFPLDKRRIEGLELDIVWCGHLHADTGTSWWNGIDGATSIKPYTTSIAPYTQFVADSDEPRGVHHGGIRTFEIDNVLNTVNTVGAYA